MKWILQLACIEDVPALEELIPLSARALLSPYYSTKQIETALGPVFGVDRQLISDGTFFVAKYYDTVVGCVGWSKRQSLFGGDGVRTVEDPLLDPATDPARIRAFFIHPDWARQGIGKAILAACEAAVLFNDFLNVELVATLGGEPFYRACGYIEVERYDGLGGGGIALPGVRMRKCLYCR